MSTSDRDLRLRVTRREEPDVDRLVELVLDMAEQRYRAYLDGAPDPYDLPLPDPLAAESSPFRRVERAGNVK